MAKFRFTIAAICTLSPFWTAQAQEVGTGLRFTPASTLLGIPLASSPYSGAELPASVDLSDRLPPPGNQGKQNSCVGWATAYALKSLQERVENGWNNVSDQDHIFSPAYIYNQINNGSDGGALFTDALNLLSSDGAAPLSAMAYSENDYTTKPSGAVRAIARQYRIDTWRQVNFADTREVKAQVNAGYPVLIGAIVDEGFKHLGADQVWSSAQGPASGGHAMLVVGYDDNRGAFKIINSWGQNWGSAGFGWIDYGYFRLVVKEAFVARDAINGAGPSPAPSPSPSPSNPTPPSVAVSTAMMVTNVVHNVPSPLGAGMQFQGTLQVPPNISGVLQVVITVAGVTAGGPVLVAGLLPQYRTPQGQAATATPALSLAGGPVTTNWSAFLPYSALNVPRGVTFGPFGPSGTPVRTDMLAYPSLFIDSFGVKAAPPIAFFVNL